MNKIQYEEIGTCARIVISQDADNADQKVKWFLKVHKTYKLLWGAYFQIFVFHPPPPPLKMRANPILDGVGANLPPPQLFFLIQLRNR